MTRKLGAPAEVQAVDEIYSVARADADQEMEKMKESLQGVHECALKVGRIQAFRSMQLLAEFMEMKQLAQLIDSKNYLKIPGVKSIDDYFEQQGIKRRTGFNDLKIARNLEPDEVQLLALLGFTRRDLLGYASLPEEKRLEIKEGKVINLESASREEIKDLIEQVVVENKQAKDEAAKSKAAANRLLEIKQKKICDQEREIAALEIKIETQAVSKGLTPDEDNFIKRVEAYRVLIQGALIALEPNELHNELPVDLTPRMRAAVISTVHNLKMQTLALYDTVVTEIGDPVINPELLEEYERWEEAQKV
ncbi:hypothetical protein GMST_35100 [Geomonas silvestris]|uniref:DUF3102 domain-containing protein n=1 Tax=Geomonas silvestris TaxID=2740184 RepID=A0A6V8MMB1_9BACT|nr:hypothetical protein [Geomonas silvestris]GFO61185.1 hypothetical protein GMST_35100 [Geomonas silvestris]